MKGAATVEARQGGQICTIQGILCVQTHGEKEKDDVDYRLFKAEKLQKNNKQSCKENASLINAASVPVGVITAPSAGRMLCNTCNWEGGFKRNI